MKFNDECLEKIGPLTLCARYLSLWFWPVKTTRSVYKPVSSANQFDIAFAFDNFADEVENREINFVRVKYSRCHKRIKKYIYTLFFLIQEMKNQIPIKEN